MTLTRLHKIHIYSSANQNCLTEEIDCRVPCINVVHKDIARLSPCVVPSCESISFSLLIINHECLLVLLQIADIYIEYYEDRLDGLMS